MPPTSAPPRIASARMAPAARVDEGGAGGAFIPLPCHPRARRATRPVQGRRGTQTRRIVPVWHLVNPALRIAARAPPPIRDLARGLIGGGTVSGGSTAIHEQIFIADRASLDHAQDLMTRFGQGAGTEAAARAERSRDLGNLVHFCRWRQVERLILLLDLEEIVGTVH